MFSSWLNKSKSKDKSNAPQDEMHYILGTTLRAPAGNNQEEILFGCGCFWGAEKGFWKLPGVITTAVGYAGGELENPSYQQVCSGKTGHTEVVRVVWDKTLIDVSDLLKLFWECHDPTQGNRQGNDRGSQYRSAIYTNKQEHETLAKNSLQAYQIALQEKGYGAITTEIRQDQIFYFAENYHQQYLAKPGSRPYCSAMPTMTFLGDFESSNYKLKKEVWLNYDWTQSHCVLRGSNEPIKE